MYSSHSFPYQFDNQQQPTQPQQYSPYTPQPTPTHPLPHSYQTNLPHPQQPSYPHTQSPQRQQPPPPHQAPQPPPQYSPYKPAESSPVNMPHLQRPESDPPNRNQEIGDPRFVLLWSMDTEELTCLLENEEKFDEMVRNMEEVKQKKLEKEMALAENRSLADFNLSREPRLKEGREQLITRLHEAQTIRDSYTVGKAKLDSVREQNSLDTALALMQASTANAEEESEEVADDFLKDDLTVEDFIDKFMPKRQTAHLRHIKAEKMQEILNQQRRARSSVPAPQGAVTQSSAVSPYSSPQHPHLPHYQQNVHGNPPYSYQPQRPAPRPPYPGTHYGPGAAATTGMPTLGPYPQ